jgi:magnesium chelatase accessory protein
LDAQMNRHDDPALTRIPPAWPHRRCSHSVKVGTLDWHVQVCGSGPVVVLLHGTGSSAHSWADVLPGLASVATVVAPDLPGHGFTSGATMASLRPSHMARALDDLMATLRLDAPMLVVGHSAGAALALRWALQSPQRPRGIVGFNPSLLSPPAAYTRLLAPLIAPIATSSAMAAFLATIGARTSLVRRLLNSTRSKIPEAQRQRYALLSRRPAHIRGAMGFITGIDLPALLRSARGIDTALTFVVGTNDRWVPERPLCGVIRRAFPAATVSRWDGGHVLHEEYPERAVMLLREALALACARAILAVAARRGESAKASPGLR